MGIQTKKEIRTYIKTMKSAMTKEEILQKSACIQQCLMEQEVYCQAKNIYIYVNYNQEVMTSDIIEASLQAGKNVYVPKVHGDVMKFHRITSVKDDLAQGQYGILEPITDCIDDSRDGLLIMPGLAFDRDFHRIGYGGGFYDKYLSLPNSHSKVALAYDFQILDTICSEKSDKEVDMIITEKEVIKAEMKK